MTNIDTNMKTIMKISPFLFLLTISISLHAQNEVEVSNGDNINAFICNGDDIEIDASDLLDTGLFSCLGGGPSFMWTSSNNSVDMFNITNNQHTMTANNVMVNTTYTVTAMDTDGNMGTATVNAQIITVNFTAYMTQRYGFDDYPSTLDDGMMGTIPWKSIEKGQDDFVNYSIILPSSQSLSNLNFASDDENDLTILPTAPPNAMDFVLLHAVEDNLPIGDEEEIFVSILSGGTEVTKCEKLNVAIYPKKTILIEFIRVIEDNDDVQVITVMQGSPNRIAISAGMDGILQATPSGDDILVVNAILTGNDGVCNTSVMSGTDDIQEIPNGQGLPNIKCIEIGANDYFDSVVSGDDMIISGGIFNDDYISTGPNGICDTPANNTDVFPNNVPTSTTPIMNYLKNTIYNQVVLDFMSINIPSTSVRDCQCNYDLNRNNTHDAFVGNTTGPEWAALMNCCSSFADKAVFFVNTEGPATSTTLGLATINTQIGVVYTGSIATSGSPLDQVTAHEIGHNLGLDHVHELPPDTPMPTPNCPANGCSPNDTDNLMWPTAGTNSTFLRKWQWDEIR